jgi:hypothetical protein
MAAVFDNFLTEQECEYILEKSRPFMEPAMLVHSGVKHKKSKSRTSHGAFFDSFQDPILAMITDRIGHVARVPPGGVLSMCFRACLRSLCVLRHTGATLGWRRHVSGVKLCRVAQPRHVIHEHFNTPMLTGPCMPNWCCNGLHDSGATIRLHPNPLCHSLRRL